MENLYKAIDADIAFFPQQDVSYGNLAHDCYKTIIKQLEKTGMSRNNMHFAGRYTYGLTLDHKGGMTLYKKGIGGADAKYHQLIGKYSAFHS